MDHDNDNDTKWTELRHAQVDYFDTKTGQLDDILNEKLERAFHEQTSQVMLHELVRIASEHDPIDLAHAATRLPNAVRPVIFDNLPDDNAKIIFLINAGSNTRSAIFRQLHEREIANLLEKMPSDDAVWMLDDMSDRLMKRVMARLSAKKAFQIRQLFEHDRESAGRLMTNEFFAFNMNTTIGKVARKIRINPGIDLTRSIFVLNDYDELIGHVPDRNLIINPPDLPIKQVMQPIIHTVNVDTDRDEVVEIMERYEIQALPVIDDYNQLIGVISNESAFEAVKDIMDETIANIAGTAEDVSEHEPVIKRYFARAPWLVVTLCAGLVTATVMTYFKPRVWFFFVPPFVPLIAGMSGNVGIQCSTLMVRSLSSGEITARTRRKTIYKEVGMGLLIGFTFGLLCGLVVYSINMMGFSPMEESNSILNSPFVISLIVTVGLFVACMNATILGSLSPFVFARLGVDPAIASGPVVTAFNDVTSTLMFFFVARTITYFIFNI